MRPLWKWGLIAGVGVAAAGFGALVHYIAPIGTAYVAKTVCSGVFVAGRDAQEVFRRDVVADNNPLLPLVRYAVDGSGMQVAAEFLGLQERVARYRPGVGCAVTFGRPLTQVGPMDAVTFQPLPTSDPMDFGVNAATLSAVVRSAFEEPDLNRLRRTHAVVVLHRGHIIAEHFAEGFAADTPHVGWSLTKTVTALLVGARIAQGRLRLEQTSLVPAWRGDARAGISIAHLLHMNSGLAFDENYLNPRSDVVRMLNEDGDFAAYATRLPLMRQPGTEFRYSSGASEIVARVLRDSFDGDDEAYWAYPREALFRPLGIGSATFEVDASGTLVGASSMYAGAHDWARIGQLLLSGGRWQGREVVPESWVRFMTTPAPSAREGEFGAHVWTSVPWPFFRASGERPELPADAFHMVGYEGQFVSVIPSHALVVVRLGLTRLDYAWDHEAFLHSLLQVIPRV